MKFTCVLILLLAAFFNVAFATKYRVLLNGTLTLVYADINTPATGTTRGVVEIAGQTIASFGPIGTGPDSNVSLRETEGNFDTHEVVDIHGVENTSYGIQFTYKELKKIG